MNHFVDEKLQKVLARAGMGSRREMERVISTGVVTVNGKPATLGDRVTEKDVIRVGGKKLGASQLRPQATRVLLYNKPEGQVCTRSDPEGRATVFDDLPKVKSGRWISVGRLDVNSAGLLLFTTDGELANRMMHPSRELEREYAVRVLGQVSEDEINPMLEGVLLEDGMAKFNSIRFQGGEASNRWYHVTISEGRNREVRRLWESQGVQVSRLIRVRYGSIELPKGLRIGRYQELERKDVNRLRKSVDMPADKAMAPAWERDKHQLKRKRRQERRR